MKRYLTPLLMAALTGPALAVDDYEAAARAFVAAADWTCHPLLVEAIRAQNARTGSLSAAEIAELDAAWRAEVGAMATPTIDGVVTAPASDFLRARMAEARGLISEAVVTDGVGLNVASSGVTSDYWRGGEEMFPRARLRGPDAIRVGALQFDDPSRSFRVQASMPVVDAGGRALGTIILSLDAAAL